MLCKSPYVNGNLPFGCGQCLPCRINKRRLWSTRIMLESYMHTASSFVTLTYDDAHLPENETLVPDDVQLWLKRLRKAYKAPLRYFLVGEYGDLSQRPHYHLALFGLACLTPFDYVGPARFKCACPNCLLVRKTWKKGRTQIDRLEPDSAHYIAGYVTKKMTSKEDSRLKGRYPEFSRQSNRPGIGAPALPVIIDSLTTDSGALFLLENKDVPMQFRMEKQKMPLGRYLRQQLRKAYGFTPKKNIFGQESYPSPSYKIQEYSMQMCQLYTDTVQASPPETRKTLGLKQVLLLKNKQKILNLETKFKIFSKKGSI